MPYRFRVCALLFALVFVMYLDRLCIAVAGPRMQHDLGLTPIRWGWVMGAFTLSYALFELPSGMLGDRIGPRKVLTRIVLWWSMFTALTGAVSSFAILLGVRFLFGAGEAGSFPNCASAISRWVPKQERARASSVFFLATSMGGAVTPLLVVWIEQHYGWRMAFYLFGALGLFWAGFWYWWFRDSPWQKAGVSQAEREWIGKPAVVHAPPVPWSRLLRNRNFQRLLLMYHTYCWGVYFFLTWLSTYLQVGRGLTEQQMGIASSLPACAGLIGIVAGGYWSDRLAKRHSLRVARCALGSASLITAGLCLICASLTADVWRTVALLTLGLGVLDVMLPVAWSLCVDIGGVHSGSISGAMNMAGQIGSLLSSVLFGYLVEWLGSYDRALLPLSAMLLVSGLFFAWIDPADPLLAEQKAPELSFAEPSPYPPEP
ncbi:MAG TPA: MFS transporter [Bryobacteraceae bacterium]|nr:MFS transporter [Bryobacteraceae bacterium]